jgi:ABC-type uncharacterized transport system substrate-binding protein
MKRREFLAALGGAAVAYPHAVSAQQSVKMNRVALIAVAAPVSDLVGVDPINPAARGFAHGLRALGHIEGRNLILEWRSAEGKYKRFPGIIEELLLLKVDVIVTVTNPMTRIAKEMTRTVPIVMASSVNPVEEGLIKSLARPGGNVTGLTDNAGESDILAKRVQLLKELLPGMSRVAFLQTEEESTGEQELSAFKAATEALGVQFLLILCKASDYAEAFDRIAREHTDGLIVGTSSANYANRRLIVEFAAKNRLPAIYGPRNAVDIGGLISYGGDTEKRFEQAAGYVDRILKGARPADLPVERPIKFLLAINLKTAKALGLEVPPLLLAQADEVIE